MISHYLEIVTRFLKILSCLFRPVFSYNNHNKDKTVKRRKVFMKKKRVLAFVLAASDGRRTGDGLWKF